MRGTGDRCNSKGIGFSSLVTGNDLKFQTNSYQSTKGNVLKVKTQLTYNNAYFNLQLVFITTQRTCKDVYLQVTTRQNNVTTYNTTYLQQCVLTSYNTSKQCNYLQHNLLTTMRTYKLQHVKTMYLQHNLLTTMRTYKLQHVKTM